MEQREDTRALTERIETLAADGSSAELRAVLADLRAEDVADQLEHLHGEARPVVFAALPPETAAEVLMGVDEEVRAQLLTSLEEDAVVSLLRLLEPADVADVIGALPEERAAMVLRRLPVPEAAEVRVLLEYPTDSAGGVMSTHFVAVRDHHTIREAVEHIRRREQDLGDFYYVYVWDAQHRLVGVTSLKDLLLARPEQRIGEIMDHEVVSVPAGADQEEAANVALRYQLFALPVVDDAGVLVGQLMLDDLADIAEEEASEDMYRIVGLPEDESVFSPLRFSVRKRLPWLFVNLVTALFAFGVVSSFEGTIARFALLAALMPIVAGMGGNAGMQTLTIVVRGLALGEVDVRNARRALFKELALGVINGALIGVVVAGVAVLLSANPWVGAIIGAALFLNMVAAGVAGATVPLLLRAFRVDPALASGVIVTTVTDCAGFFFFLGLATLMLRHLG